MALVERLAVPASAAYDETAVPPQGAKGAIAENIADIIVEQGWVPCPTAPWRRRRA